MTEGDGKRGKGRRGHSGGKKGTGGEEWVPKGGNEGGDEGAAAGWGEEDHGGAESGRGKRNGDGHEEGRKKYGKGRRGHTKRDKEPSSHGGKEREGVGGERQAGVAHGGGAHGASDVDVTRLQGLLSASYIDVRRLKAQISELQKNWETERRTFQAEIDNAYLSSAMTGRHDKGVQTEEIGTDIKGVVVPSPSAAPKTDTGGPRAVGLDVGSGPAADKANSTTESPAAASAGETGSAPAASGKVDLSYLNISGDSDDGSDWADYEPDEEPEPVEKPAAHPSAEPGRPKAAEPVVPPHRPAYEPKKPHLRLPAEVAASQAANGRSNHSRGGRHPDPRDARHEQPRDLRDQLRGGRDNRYEHGAQRDQNGGRYDNYRRKQFDTRGGRQDFSSWRSSDGRHSGGGSDPSGGGYNQRGPRVSSGHSSSRFSGKEQLEGRG